MNQYSEEEQIRSAIQHYIDGAISGKSEDMKPAFYKNATLAGYVGTDLFAGPIQGMYEWHDNNGAAENLQLRDIKIDFCHSIASARLELEDWTGHKFTDMFLLLKLEGEWKITGKVFHLHA